MRILTDKKGLTPVVATIILCGVVLILGISAWSLTYSVSRNLQTSYYEGIKKQMDTISERFIIEHIAYDGNNLHVWVYNYGNISYYGGISIDIVSASVWRGTEYLGSRDFRSNPITISSADFAEITVTIGILSAGNELVVHVTSGRDNDVYQTYVFPG